ALEIALQGDRGARRGGFGAYWESRRLDGWHWHGTFLWQRRGQEPGQTVRSAERTRSLGLWPSRSSLILLPPARLRQAPRDTYLAWAGASCSVRRAIFRGPALA